MSIVYIIIIIIIIIISQVYFAVIFKVTVCIFNEVLTSTLPSKGSGSMESLTVRT
jgi:hypothetical protein